MTEGHPHRSDESARQAAAMGIVPQYTNTSGHAVQTSEMTQRALMAAMGSAAGMDEPQRSPLGQPQVKVIRRGQTPQLSGPAELTLEDGSTLQIPDALPPDLPLGYHDLRPLAGDAVIRLIVCPGQCHLDPAMQTWGWSAQLYELRSSQSWGMGDFGDLQRLARWSRQLGAGVLLVNPLQASAPVVPQQPSPYYPSSRRFRNPLYLRIEDVPGAAAHGLDLEPLAAAGKALNAERLIDRDRVFQLKSEALNTLWSDNFADPAFERFCADQGAALTTWATFCTLAERYGGDWRQWAEEYRRADSPAVQQAAEDYAGRVRYHKWLQWLLDEQFRRASRELPLVQDLPIGFEPGGADAWTWQDLLATDVTIGAPPDEFNSNGQDWGLPAFIPHKLADARYEPFIQTLRSALRHSRGLRIDHVMGLFRLFWIPEGLGPQNGAFVRYPADDLLGIVALESQRAGAWIAGEDLGTIDQDMRQCLAAHQFLSYRVLWFEHEPPEAYPRNTLAAVTTHDLPTVAGFWSGADAAARRERDLPTNDEGWNATRQRVMDMAGLPPECPAELVVEKLHALLGRAPSAVRVATLSDALAVAERPNMPGTVDQWPNWRIALPLTLEQLEQAILPKKIAAAFSARA